MASALIEHMTDEERCATLNIAITYLRTAREGDIVCRTTLDRRGATNAALRSEVVHEDGDVLATAVGTYAIFAGAVATRRAARHEVGEQPAAQRQRPRGRPSSVARAGRRPRAGAALVAVDGELEALARAHLEHEPLEPPLLGVEVLAGVLGALAGGDAARPRSPGGATFHQRRPPTWLCAPGPIAHQSPPRQ